MVGGVCVDWQWKVNLSFFKTMRTSDTLFFWDSEKHLLSAFQFSAFLYLKHCIGYSFMLLVELWEVFKNLFLLVSYLHQFVEAKIRMTFMVETTMPTLDVCLMSQHDLVSPLIVLTRKNHQREPRSLRSHQAVSFVAKFVCCWKETSRLDKETFVHSMSFKHRSGLVRVAVLDEEQWVEVWKDDLEWCTFFWGGVWFFWMKFFKFFQNKSGSILDSWGINITWPLL